MKEKKGIFPVIVIGGGHAGVEAAFSVMRLGLKVLLISRDSAEIAKMHCNPSIGGPAKGILVREIDSLGGEMGKAADFSSLHSQMCNTSYGEAVQAVRTQNDKEAYSSYMWKKLNENSLFAFLQDTVEELIFEKKKEKRCVVTGCRLGSKKEVFARSVVLTAGTFIKPLILRGKKEFSLGPDNKLITTNLGAQLIKAGFSFLRFKTGTPPRIKADTINFSSLKKINPPSEPLFFSEQSYRSFRGIFHSLPVYLSRTNFNTHQIVRKNLDSFFVKKELAIGPRYCPSLELKTVLYPEKEDHQIFLEPETVLGQSIYPQGLSLSLASSVQKAVIRSIVGLEKAELIRYGFAIQYDAINPKDLNSTLETKLVNNLWLAGQINCTTGYEEAAAQGLVAGLNAARAALGKKQVILDPKNSYIGFLIDDLVSRPIVEPYRVLTSKSSERMFLRHDNSSYRLKKMGYHLGLVSLSDWTAFSDRSRVVSKIISFFEGTFFVFSKKILRGKYDSLIFSAAKIKRISAVLYSLFKKGNYDFKKKEVFFLKNIPSSFKFSDCLPIINLLADDFKFILSIDKIFIYSHLKYLPLIKRHRDSLNKFEALKSNWKLENVDWNKINNLSNETRDIIKRYQPRFFSELLLLPGISLSEVRLISIFFKKQYSTFRSVV